MILAILAAACVQASSVTPGSISDDWPAARFRGNATVKVQFMSPEQVQKVCSPKPVCGYVTDACTITESDGSKLIVLPNPNQWKGDYRKLVAHEAGHWMGWPGTHGP